MNNFFTAVFIFAIIFDENFAHFAPGHNWAEIIQTDSAFLFECSCIFPRSQILWPFEFLKYGFCK